MFYQKWISCSVVIAMLCFGLMVPSSVFAEKVLKIGCIAPLTGPSARTGEEIRDSATLAFEQHGNKIGDYKVKLVWIDSQSDPAKATNAYAEAVDRKGIQVGLLNWHSSVAVAIMDLAAKYKIPHLFGIGGTSVINDKYKTNPKKYAGYWLKSWPEPKKTLNEYVDCLEYLIKTGKLKVKNKKVALFAGDTDWGRDVINDARSMFNKAGWKVVSADTIPLTKTEFYPLVSKWKSMGVSVVFGSISAVPPIASLIKQAREIKLKAQLICDGLGWMGEWYSMTGNASNGVLDMIQKLATPEAKAWAKSFKKKYGYEPSPSSGGLAFDSANFFIKIAKRTLKKYGQINAETLRKVVLDEVLTGKLTYTAADGAITVPRFRYTPNSVPDPVVGIDDWYMPVIQYENGKGKIIYPPKWAEAEYKSR